MNLKNRKNWAFFDLSRPKTAQYGSGYQWSAAGQILSFGIFSGPKFTILSWRSTSTLTKTVFGTFSDSFSLALNKVARYHPKRTKNGLRQSRGWLSWQNGKFGTRKNTKTQNWACGWPLVAQNHFGRFLGMTVQKMPNFFGFLDSFGLFFNTQLNSKRKKNIFLEKWALGVLSPQGPPGPPLGLRAKFGLVSDPGGLANDVSKAKNLIQFFSVENACFSQSRPVKAISKMVFFRFGEIINIMILSFVKKNFVDFFFNSL